MVINRRSIASFTAMCAFLAVVSRGEALADEQAPSPTPAAPTVAPSAAEAPPRMYIRDGQLLTHPLTVFVTEQIEPGMNPRLRLAAAHWVTEEGALEKVPPRLLLVAPRQIRTIMVAGSEIQGSGTLLIFRIERPEVPIYKSAVRLLPAIEWTAAAATPGKPAALRQVVAEEDIYVGNWPGALLWTAVVVSLILVALGVWSYSKRRQITQFTPRPLLLLITGPDGYLSLWRTQLLLWTVAVGSLVFFFGLMQLHVPEVPESLVLLMGMSLLTGLFAKAAPTQGAAPPATPPATSAPGSPASSSAVGTPAASVTPQSPPSGAPAPGPATPTASSPPVAPGGLVRAHFGDLISTWNSDAKRLEFSLPKAQMVLWTVLVLALFCIKSVLNGTLWPVPWQMVALTGFSQSGYIGDKFIKQQQ
jgi:hypothetical protein